jgi:ribonuclease BN (tRNA processing enzyme)
MSRVHLETEKHIMILQMKVIILGSGTALPKRNRVGSGFLIEANGRNILFDCGRGVVQRIVETDIDIFDIDRVFISHPHADHMADLVPLVQAVHVKNQYVKKKGSLYLHGYPGFKKDFEAIDNILHPEETNFDLIVSEQGNKTLKFDGIKIETHLVPHVPKFFSSLGFRLRAEEKTVMYSGDSGFGKVLLELANEVDLAIIETSMGVKRSREKGEVPNHLSASEVGRIGREAKVEKLVVSHNYEFDTEEELRSVITKEFKGEVMIAKDLMSIVI